MRVCDELVMSLLGGGGKPRLAEACLGRGVVAFYRSGRADDALVETLLQSLDADLSRQLDEILHHPRFVALESIWRATWFLVSRVDTTENIKCDILNCSKEDLLFDFDDAPEIPKSSLFKQTHSAEYGPFGGRPFAALIAHYEFSADPEDLRLLAMCGDTVRHSCMPFIGAASVGLRASDAEVWRTFRLDPGSRFVALVTPRALGRAPHPGRDSNLGFGYRETIRQRSELPSIHGAYLLGVCMARTFARSRLASIPTGPVFGKVDVLPSWSGSSLDAPGYPSDEDRGFVVLAEDPASRATFVREAPLCMSPAAPFAQQLSASDRVLNLELSSLLFIGRFVHYIKVVHREQIGTWKEREMLQEELRAQLSAWTGSGPTESDAGAAPRDPAELTLLATIEASDDASEPLAVYADWLEERSRSSESEFIRLQLALRALGPEDPLSESHKVKLAELAHRLEPSWRAVVGREGPVGLRSRHPLHRFELHVDDVPENQWWWRLRLEVEPNWSIDGRFARLVVDNRLDRE